MNTRNWSIRSKIIALVAVPLTALLALWIFATALTIGPAFNLLSARTLLDTVGKPGEVLVAELQVERRLSVEFLSARDGDGGVLASQRITTDEAVAAFRGAASSEDARDAASELLQGRIDQIFGSLDSLPAGRGYVDRREIDVARAQDSYNAIIENAFKMFTATATFNNPQIDREIRALTTIGRGREMLAQGDALLAGAQVAGSFTGTLLGRLNQAIGTQRFLYADAIADLPEADRVAYQRLVDGDAFVRLRQMQDTILQTARPGSAPPVQATTWQAAYDSAVQQLRAYEATATESLAGRAAPVAVGILLRLALAGILGLTAVVVSVLVSVRVGRSLIGRLIKLRAAALQVAGERLPKVVRRLQRGENVDIDAEAPPLEYGEDEIGQLGRAFTEVQRTAVQSAIDEANVRRGLNEVFLNIARRSQTLLHRQLALLDRMERRQADPQELEDLYNVDHLATRMRRHAEDLVILAGATPGRGWRNPVPVVDVVRGAISEVEDYKRIDVSNVEAASVIGRAVGDVIHLLAELLENAASFSPPHTRVHVAGQVVPNGYAVEIEDRGLGMSADALDDANRRLLEPPDFDPGDSARLGLFVVAQLAGRHGIRVQLRSSPYGGVTAVALIPGDLITATPGPGPVALTAGPSGLSSLPGLSTLSPFTEPVALSGPAGSWDRPTAGIGSEPWSGATRTHAGQPGGTDTADAPARNGRPRSLADPAQAFLPYPPASFAPPAPVEAPPQQSRPERLPPTGPTVDGPPSDGLTVDGLAQRRRTRPRTEPSAGDLSLAELFGADHVAPDPAAPSVAFDPVGIPAGRAGATDDPDDDGLPKRVRQANLVSHLRLPTVEPVAEAPQRSPEQIRARMSALQAGTVRGRQDAETAEPSPATDLLTAGKTLSPVAWFTDAPPGDGPVPGTTWADAATATFPLTAATAPADGPGDAEVTEISDPAGGAEVVEPGDLAGPDGPVPADQPDALVHHGEIVPRQSTGPDGDPPPDWPAILPTGRPGGQPTHSDKDA
jgi:signal transduction histidine kinase